MLDPGRNAIVREDSDGDVFVTENGTEQVTKDDHFTYKDAQNVLEEDGYHLTAGEDGIYVFTDEED